MPSKGGRKPLLGGQRGTIVYILWPAMQTVFTSIEPMYFFVLEGSMKTLRKHIPTYIPIPGGVFRL